MPVVYEDEGQEEMGDSASHSSTMAILAFGIQAHLSGQPEYNVFWNLNLYYHPSERNAYVSPDVMVVAPYRPLGRISSYRIGEDGPRRSWRSKCFRRLRAEEAKRLADERLREMEIELSRLRGHKQ